MYANKFCDAGQVPIFRYFEAWSAHNLCKQFGARSGPTSKLFDTGSVPERSLI